MALKVTLKRKNNIKDDHLSKKGTVQLIREQQQKASSPLLPPLYGAEKGLMIGKGPVALSPVQRLVTYKDYVIEMVSLIIKETDLDPCGEHSLEDLGASGLYNLSREIENKEWAQYLEAIRTLNQELMAKTKALVEETHRLEEAEKTKTNLAMELAALHDTVPPTPRGDDTVSNETVDSIHMIEHEVKDTDRVVIAKPTLEGPDVIVVSSGENPTTVEGLFVVNPTAPDASLS
nr:hypothetical protein CFP56_47041 [Quercus suber]